MKKIINVFTLTLSLALLVLLTSCMQSDVPTKYSISIDQNITNGVVVASAESAVQGTEITLTVTPNSGYVLKENSLKANDEIVEDNKFTMPAADVVVTAEFVKEEKETYTIKIGEVEHGSISASRRSGSEGDSVTVTVTAENGYELVPGSLKANDVEIVDNKFTVPAANVVITALFQLKSYNVTVGNVENGQVSVSSTTAKMGDEVTVTATPDTDYILDKIYVNGSVSSSTFVMGAEDVEVTATFTYSPVGDNLGDALGMSATDGFDVSTDKGSNAYINQTAGDQQYIFFKELYATDFVATTKVTANAVLNGDSFPRFGLAMYNSNTTVYYNVEASGLTGTKMFAVVGTLGTGNWNWGSMLELDHAATNYSGEGYIELTVVKSKGEIYYYVNGNLINVCGYYGGLGADDSATIALVTMNIDAKFFDYSYSTDESEIAKYTIANHVEDLSFIEGTSTVAKVVGTEEYAGKSVTFYGQLTSEGLYLAALANHAAYKTTEGNWWLNTNFEVFVNGGNQFYYSAMNGGTTNYGVISAMVSEKAEGSNFYTTTVEMFIPREFIAHHISEDSIRVGFAWKTISDVCNNGNDGITDYWLVPGHPANNYEQQFVVNSTGIVAPKVEEPVEPTVPTVALGGLTGELQISQSAGWDLSTNAGENAYVTQTHGDQQYVFFQDLYATDFIATTKVTATAVMNGDAHPRFGIAAYNNANTVFFNIEGSNNLADTAAKIVVGKLGTGEWDWGGMATGVVGSTGYTGDKYVELTIVKKGATLYFFVDGKLSLVKSGFAGMSANDKAGVALFMMNISAKYFDYSYSTDANEINNAIAAYSTGIDGELDWTNGMTPQSVVGTEEYAGKSVEFYGLLTEKGLYLGAVATHSVFTNNAGNWWENTNFEVFVNGGNQFYYSAMNGGTTNYGVISAMVSEKAEGSNFYTTTVEMFIPREFIAHHISEDSIRVGFAWKTISDVCNNGNDGITDYWLVPGHPANNYDRQFTVNSTGITA